MVISAVEHHHMTWIFIGLLVASAGVMEHSGIKIPYFAFFAHDSGMRVKEAPWNMLVAMVAGAALCLLIGLFPAPLYSILPFPVGDYEPYTADHVLTSFQLLVFAILAFAVLVRTGIYPPEKAGINLDFDWTYRKMLPALIRRIDRGHQPLHRGLFDRGGRAARSRLPARLPLPRPDRGLRPHLERPAPSPSGRCSVCSGSCCCTTGGGEFPASARSHALPGVATFNIVGRNLPT